MKQRKVTSLRKGWQVEEAEGWLTVDSVYALTFANGAKETHVLYVEPYKAIYDDYACVLSRTLTEQARRG